MKRVKFLLLPLIVMVISLGAKAQDINTVVEQFNKGAEAYQAGDYLQAITDLEQAYSTAFAVTDEDAEETIEGIKTNCKNMIPFAYSAIANTLASESKFDEAIDYFNKSLVVAKKYGNTDITEESVAEKINAVYVAQAAVYLRDGERDKALDIIAKTEDDEAIGRIKKSVAVLYRNEANDAYKEKNYKTAIERANKSLEYDAESDNAYQLIGFSYIQQNQQKNAIEALEKCLALKESATIYNTLAGAYQKSGNNAKACQCYRKVVDPNMKATAQQITNAQNQIKVVCK